MLAERAFVRFKSHGTYLDVGERPTALAILRAGTVAVGTRGAYGDFVITDLVSQGDVIGVGAILLDAPSVLAVKILDGSAEFLCIPSAEFRSLVQSEPDLADAVNECLAMRCRRLALQVNDLKSRSVPQRLGRYLLSLAERIGHSDIRLPVEKRLLASYLGTTPETLSRAFGVLRSCGVATKTRSVSLSNVPELRRYVRPDTVT
jgi:CRP/FNR family transcriptional activator FtrB